jgi:hypothetical protein
MSKPAYREAHEIQKAQVRLGALSLAHDREAPPEQVVERAKAYLEFIEAEPA